jgi:predicted nucleotidyltransferase
MRELANEYYSTTMSSYHYLKMASSNYRESLKRESVWLKNYFYVLRPILAVKWIQAGLGVVPTQFDILVDRFITEPNLKLAIEALMEGKREGQELDQATN